MEIFTCAMSEVIGAGFTNDLCTWNHTAGTCSVSGQYTADIHESNNEEYIWLGTNVSET